MCTLKMALTAALPKHFFLSLKVNCQQFGSTGLLGGVLCRRALTLAVPAPGGLGRTVSGEGVRGTRVSHPEFIFLPFSGLSSLSLDQRKIFIYDFPTMFFLQR